MRAARRVEGNPGNDGGNIILYFAENCAEAESNYQPRLLARMREALRSRHYSRRTEQTYCNWVKRFIFYHNLRHPAEMGEPEINAFLTHLAVKQKVRAIHERDLTDGWGRVLLPDALDRKYPEAPKEWRRQWVFPQENRWQAAAYRCLRM